MLGLELRFLPILAVNAYADVLIAYIIVGWLQAIAGFSPPEWLRPAFNFVYDVSDPFLRIWRGMLPPLRLGGMGLDLSPIIGFIALRILANVLTRILF